MLSEELHQRLDLMGARLWAAARRLWSHPRVAQIYPELLFRFYSLARANLSVLQAAVDRLETLTDDPVAAGLLGFLRDFMPEELGHDEWVLEDLEALGISRQAVLARMPPAAVASLMGAQYYWIHHHHPLSVLGYCFVAETRPAPLDQVEDLIRRTGLPRTAFRTLLRHAVLDVEHGAAVERFVDSLSLTREQLSIVGVSLAHTAHCMALSTEELVDLYEG